MGESITDVVFSLIAAGATASENGSKSWLIPAIFTLLAGGIFWLTKDKFAEIKSYMKERFDSLREANRRTEEKLDKGINRLDVGLMDVVRETKSIDRRVLRIEGQFGLGPLFSDSPIKLTEVGKQILRDSGIKEAADNNASQLLETIRAENLDTAWDIQESMRKIFQTFDFGADLVRRIKDYSFHSGKWGLYDILDVGAIYFRDIALKEFGYEVKDIDDSDPAKHPSEDTQ